MLVLLLFITAQVLSFTNTIFIIRLIGGRLRKHWKFVLVICLLLIVAASVLYCKVIYIYHNLNLYIPFFSYWLVLVYPFFFFDRVKLDMIFSCIIYILTLSFIETIVSYALLPEIKLSSLDVNAVIDTAFGFLVLGLLLLANKYMYKDAMLKFTAVVPKYVFVFIFLYLIFTPIIMQGLAFSQNTTAVMPVEVKDRLSFTRLMFGVFSIIVFIVIFTLLFQTVANRKYEKATELLKMQMENQIQHYSEVNQIQHEMRAFRHDMKSQMLCIRTMIEKNQAGQAVEYLDKTWGMVEKNTQCFDTGNSIIDALIADKQQRAAQYNTKIIFTGFLPVEGVDLLDLCIIISNTLDNAIEACEKDVSQGDKEIIFDSRVLQGYLVMRFQNPVFAKVDIINDAILTTKTDKNNHGFGLYNIKKVVKKYGGDFKVCLQDDNFCLETTLHCESKNASKQQAP